jgi:hypothetical protein
MYLYMYIYIYVMYYTYKVKFTLDQTTKAHRGRRIIALLFL